MPSVRATLIGFSAILMWSLLALLTVLSGRVPPFQLLAMTFAVGGALGARLARARERLARAAAAAGRCGRSASAACSAITRSISPRSGWRRRPKPD